MQFRFTDWVGRYRLVISRELLEFIERAFVEPLPPAEQDAARARALHEARGSELEIRAGGSRDFAVARRAALLRGAPPGRAAS
jgi:hypothetical protein